MTWVTGLSFVRDVDFTRAAANEAARFLKAITQAHDGVHLVIATNVRGYFEGHFDGVHVAVHPDSRDGLWPAVLKAFVGCDSDVCGASGQLAIVLGVFSHNQNGTSSVFSMQGWTETKGRD